MTEITQEVIDEAIRNCPWRRDVAGVHVCVGDVAPCSRLIKSGKCDTLIRLFAGKCLFDK